MEATMLARRRQTLTLHIPVLIMVLLAFVAPPVVKPAAAQRPEDTLPTFSTFINLSQYPQGPSDLLWTGKMFLISLEHTTWMLSADAHGGHVTNFASMLVGDETHCVLPPSSFAYPKQTVFCSTDYEDSNNVYHAVVYAISLAAPKRPPSLFAKIPISNANDDGAITFDSVGKFHHSLLVVTGGSYSTSGGSIYEVDPHRHVS
jgi:hypothetical protein